MPGLLSASLASLGIKRNQGGAFLALGGLQLGGVGALTTVAS